MEVRIEEAVPPRHVAAIEHIGPYETVGTKFGQLGQWVKQAGVQNTGDLLAIYYDDPNVTPAEQLRSEACIEVPADTMSADPNVRLLDLPGGRCAVATHRGSYRGLGAAWYKFYSEWLPANGCQSDPTREPFEIYVVGCEGESSESDLVTDLYAPIRSA